MVRENPVPRAALLVAIFLSPLGCALAQEPLREVSGVPPLPHIALDMFPPSIHAKVQKAYAAAVKHPLDASANGRLGMVLQAYNPSDTTAEICYRRARVFDPSSFRWVYYLGLVEAERRKCDEATAVFREALQLDPDYLPAEIRLGQCLLSSGKEEQARKVFDDILTRHPDNARAHYELGRADEARDNPNGAIESFRKACDLFPSFGAAHYALARAYQRLGKTDQARDEFAIADKHKYEGPDWADPLLTELQNIYTDPQYFMEMGVQFANQGHLKEAVAQHEKALALDPRLFKAHINLISLYGRLHEFDKAEEHYRAAVEARPNDPQIYYDHGVLLMEQGKNAEAEEAFRKALELDPRQANAHNNLGDLLQRQGKLDAAVAEFRKAIDSKPDFPQAHFNLGRILIQEENYTEGIAELTMTLDAADEDAKPSYLYALGAAYARSGDRENGLRYLKLAREQAAAKHQSELLESIVDDLETLEKGSSPIR